MNWRPRRTTSPPPAGCSRSAQCFGGPVRFVLAGSGHIAGVVNPAGKPKYQFWTDGPPRGEFDDWVAKAKETPGSWWTDWIQWVAAQAPAKVARPQARRRQAETARRRAGGLCAREGVRKRRSRSGAPGPARLEGVHCDKDAAIKASPALLTQTRVAGRKPWAA